MATKIRIRILYYYCGLTLSQEFQPMTAQLSMKGALPLAKILARASYRSSNTGPSDISRFYVACHGNWEAFSERLYILLPDSYATIKMWKGISYPQRTKSTDIISYQDGNLYWGTGLIIIKNEHHQILVDSFATYFEMNNVVRIVIFRFLLIDPESQTRGRSNSAPMWYKWHIYTFSKLHFHQMWSHFAVF